MSPTYQPSGLRDLRTHSNAGIVLDDTAREGGVRRKIFEADKKRTTSVCHWLSSKNR